MRDLVARLHELGIVLAERMPETLAATIALLESMLDAAERLSTAPVSLTAERVHEAARAYGVPAFGGAIRDRRILLASFELDLRAPGIRAELLEMHHRGELRLVRLGDPHAVREDLAARRFRPELVDESILSDGDATFHAVNLP